MPIHAFMLPIRATVFGAVPRSVNLPRILLIGSVSQIFLNAMLPAILVKMMGAVDAAWGDRFINVHVGIILWLFCVQQSESPFSFKDFSMRTSVEDRLSFDPRRLDSVYCHDLDHFSLCTFAGICVDLRHCWIFSL